MKSFVLLLAGLLAPAPTQAQAPRKTNTPHPPKADATTPEKLTLGAALCFEKGQGLFVQAANGSVAEKWLDALHVTDAQIAPGGDAIAFTLDTPQTESHGVEDEEPLFENRRHIAILDRKSSKPRILKSIPGSQNCQPVWSPDGKLLMFLHYDDDGNGWSLAVIRRDGSGFRNVFTPASSSSDLFIGSWANDSKTLYCFDFDFLYQIDLQGRVVSRLAFEDTDLKISSVISTRGYKFKLSPDGKQMLVETRDYVDDLWNGGDPTPVIFLLDLATGKSRRVSPNGMMLTDPDWLGDGKSFVCTVQHGKEPGIYRVELDSGHAKLVLSGGSRPSVSR